MTPDTSATNPTQQAPQRGVQWSKPLLHQEPAQALLRGDRHDRGATAPGRGVTVGIDITCPTCGHDDQVQNVPAVHATGTSVVRGVDSHSGFGISSVGVVPVVGYATVDRVHSTHLAQALTVAPMRRRSGKLVFLGLFFAIPACFYLLFTIVALKDPDAEVSWPWIVAASFAFILALATPSILLFWTALRRTRRNNRISRGLPVARHVWRAGYYCHRCGSCYWPYQPAAGVPVRYALSPNQFRSVVWSAGGYANL
ncbi:hypothetical protein [Nocardia sp. NPDC059239]|uniref:hypothetical protein n=1 Tax=unclassified Nocardia TaxID=2637762 RepID=UPI0036A6FC8E